MIIKSVCEICGKEFIESKEKSNDRNIRQACLEHEMIEHIGADKIFLERITEALKILDKLYDTTTTLSDYTFNVHCDYGSGINNVSYDFGISNQNIKKKYIGIDVYRNYTKVPSYEDILNELEKHFKLALSMEYEGVLKTDDRYLGGYMLNGEYVLDILDKLKGERIKIVAIN